KVVYAEFVVVADAVSYRATKIGIESAEHALSDCNSWGVQLFHDVGGGTFLFEENVGEGRLCFTRRPGDVIDPEESGRTFWSARIFVTLSLTRMKRALG